ncbi:uncharacterized protein C6orf136 homolog [Trichomycterus rosablanca]|uniref:uncharacterized protein C6orf136 homolog n=1 Tax=Trichomycterus rosablanca TaxID=2290929 RepID=UPI002F34F725
MAVCRGGVSFWVGCIRSHGGRQLIPKHSWSVWQTVLNGNIRSLRSATWALAPPNNLHYQFAQKPYLSHTINHGCQGAEEDWEETVSMCVLLKPRESEDQPTLVEVPLFGQVKLSELLAWGANKPADFPFLLTTVDGRREDDISVIGKLRTETKPDPEQSSFRSLFETEGCPAPFTLGSRFFCFHCPGMEFAPMPGDNLRTGYDANEDLPTSYTSLYSYAEMQNTQRGSSEKDMENEEKLAVMYEKLRMELPRFFLKNHDYSMYSIDVEFINGLLNTKTRGRVAYQLSLTLWRILCLCYYADARLEVLKLTKHPEDGSIKARWRVKGLPFHTLFLRFYKKDKSQFYRTFDAFSTFYLGSNGLIQCHKVEKVMQAQPPVLPKVTSLLAGALVALGLQEDRPAFNLLPLFLSSFRQARD